MPFNIEGVPQQSHCYLFPKEIKTKSCTTTSTTALFTIWKQRQHPEQEVMVQGHGMLRRGPAESGRPDAAAHIVVSFLWHSEKCSPVEIDARSVVARPGDAGRMPIQLL